MTPVPPPLLQLIRLSAIHIQDRTHKLRKSASQQSVRRRRQLTLHATRREHLTALALRSGWAQHVLPVHVVGEKPKRAVPAIVEMQASIMRLRGHAITRNIIRQRSST